MRVSKCITCGTTPDVYESGWSYSLSCMCEVSAFARKGAGGKTVGEAIEAWNGLAGNVGLMCLTCERNGCEGCG